MKDSEFIELLNLYLDHEISAADAARLEAEVQSNPERRKVYQQYCRMQKACKVLAADFVTPGETVEVKTGRKVVSFNAAAAEAASGRRKRIGNLYTIGTFAAAACLAFVFVSRNREAAEQASAIAQQQTSNAPTSVAKSSPAVSSAVAETRAVLVSTGGVELGPRSLGVPSNGTIVADPLLLTSKAQTDALMAATLQQAKAQFAWIESMQLAPIPQPLPASELRFEAAPATLRPEGRALGNRPPANANVELAAFQFVK